ncbi:hypothetical protein C8R46DRAFT_1227381 [Mycena filopes]|nr:hypothetical protein C8R46DRAFT_1227381 [Mycena filopes]
MSQSTLRHCWGLPTPTCTPIPTCSPELTHLLVRATIRHLEALENIAPRFHTYDTTTTRSSKAAANNELNEWVAQQLGGNWPLRATNTTNAFATTPRGHGLDLAQELLTPQARVALATLSGNEVDSDTVLAVLNIGAATPATQSVPWDTLLSPQAQFGLDAIAQGERRAPESADEVLDILNAGATRGVDDDSWMAALLSAEAQEGLAALGGLIEDSDALLAVLNAGVESAINDGDERSWEEEVLTPEMRSALSVLEARGCNTTSDDVLLALNIAEDAHPAFGHWGYLDDETSSTGADQGDFDAADDFVRDTARWECEPYPVIDPDENEEMEWKDLVGVTFADLLQRRNGLDRARHLLRPSPERPEPHQSINPEFLKTFSRRSQRSEPSRWSDDSTTLTLSVPPW